MMEKEKKKCKALPLLRLNGTFNVKKTKKQKKIEFRCGAVLNVRNDQAKK